MSTTEPVTIKRALISVSDKTGIIEFAQALHKLGVEIISTGGTAKTLAEHEIPVIEISDYTGFPEMMAGRVKTLHPKIHGGLLGRADADAEIMDQHNIPPIDLLVVNLYPFVQTINRPDCDLPMAIENIDIGGPAMLRSAAKNHNRVTVAVDPADYQTILNEISANKGISYTTRFMLAQKVFAHTAQYDGAIAQYLVKFTDATDAEFPETLQLQYSKKQTMRYGENPHQKAAFYIEPGNREPSLATAKQLQGKALSFNNVADGDAALEMVKQFDTPACVIVKHANPCGVALADTPLLAYQRAYQTDPTSAFGGIIAFNKPLNAETVQTIIQQQFVEMIIAPNIAQEAIDAASKKQNIRLLQTGGWDKIPASLDFKRVTGGMLVQEHDLGTVTQNDLKVVSQRQPSAQEFEDLLFAWQVVKFVKSNAIVYARELQTIGIGAGQMSRVYSAKIAGIKAADENLDVKGSVMASDAFFPFRDGIDAAHAAGIRAVIQPGGSMRDEEVIQAADEHNIAMVFTGMRHFRH